MSPDKSDLLFLIISIIKSYDKKSEADDLLLQNHKDFLNYLQKEYSNIDNKILLFLYLFIYDKINNGFNNYYFYGIKDRFNVFSFNKNNEDNIFTNTKITSAKSSDFSVQTDVSNILYNLKTNNGNMQRNISLYNGVFELIRFESEKEKISNYQDYHLKLCSKLRMDKVLYRDFKHLNVITELKMDDTLKVKKYLANLDNLENIETEKEIDSSSDYNLDDYDNKIRYDKTLIVNDAIQSWIANYRNSHIDSNSLDKDDYQSNENIYDKIKDFSLDDEIYEFIDELIEKSNYRNRNR